MLANILRHANSNIPYYKGMPNINASLDISGIPLLSKEDIRKYSSDMVAPSNFTSDPYWNTSGGSTGEPVRILQDKNYLACSRYLTYSQKKLTGFRWGMPWIKIWGNEQEIFSGKKTFRSIATDKIKNLHTLNSFRMTNSDKDYILAKIDYISPVLIVGYVQSMYEIAKYAKKHGGFAGSVDAIIVSAGTLYPFMQQTIEEVFSAPVFNRYGSREVGNIAISSCDNSDMIVSKGVWVEIIDESGNVAPAGKEGEVVVTSLVNYAMPLIRYRIGDRGALQTENNNGDLVLKSITGRTVDMFRTVEGVQVDGEYFTHLIYFRDWIEKFQFVQEELDHIIVNIIPVVSPPQSDVLEIEQKIKVVMGDGCRVSFNFLTELADPQSGKFRFTISHVA